MILLLVSFLGLTMLFTGCGKELKVPEAPKDTIIINQDGKKYFDDLKINYKNTKYYKELLKECSDFRTYINNK